jgi:carboxyl-terminal processing protease
VKYRSIRRSWIQAAAAAALCGCAGVVLGPDASLDSPSLYDQFWREFDRHYAMFGVKTVDWQAVREQHRPAPGADNAALFAALRNSVDLLDDPHVLLRTPVGNHQSAAARARVPTRFSTSTVTARYLTGAAATPGQRLLYGWLAPRVGYMRIPSFAGSGWSAGVDDVIEALGELDALVLDVRDNGGGNNDNAALIASRFAADRRIAGYYRYRNGPRHDDFTAFLPIHVEPAGRRFAGRVVVLTNRRVASAAEDFLLRVREAAGGSGNVIVVGDTTMGAMGNPLLRELANGWVFQLSEWMMYDAARVTHEDVGLAPDIVVQLTAADSSAGRDRQLERAMQEAGAPAARAP